MAIAPKQLLDILVQQKVLDQQTADRYAIEALQKNQAIDVFLFEKSDLKKEDILKAKAQVLNVPFVDISTAAVDPQSISLLPESVSRRLNIIPYSFDPRIDTIYVATTDPLDLNLADFLEKKTGKKVTLSLANNEDLLKAINLSYTQGLSPEVTEALQEVEPEQQKDNIGSTSIHEAPIAKIINTILEFAVKSRCSDIHIEPEENKTRVRYRIDGILNEKLTLPKSIHDSLISRVKILSEMKIDERRIPQDGRFNFKVGGEEVDLRVSTLPTVNGEKVVMRLLKKTGGLPTLTDLGMRGTQLKDLEDAILKPYGIILVTGPTGSGKTTTLYSLLTKLNKPSVNIVTLEDPVE